MIPYAFFTASGCFYVLDCHSDLEARINATLYPSVVRVERAIGGMEVWNIWELN